MVMRTVSALRQMWRGWASPPGLPIRTRRLMIRLFEIDDWRAVHEYRSDPSVLTFLDRVTPYSEGEVYDIVTQFRQTTRASPRVSSTLAIVRLSDGKLLGECGVNQFHLDRHYLGFLLRRDAWGQGYGTEAAAATMRYAFTHLRARRILAGCHPDNSGSRRVLEKVGMTRMPAAADFPSSPPGILSLVFEAEAGAWLRAHPLAP